MMRGTGVPGSTFGQTIRLDARDRLRCALSNGGMVASFMKIT
jgi:hypothetical protein